MLTIRQEIFGPEDPQIAHALNHKALVLYDLNCYNEAETLFKKVRSIREKLPPEGRNYELATTMHDLAELYRAQGRFNEAEPLFKSALQIREEVLGYEHSLTVKTRTALTACNEKTKLHQNC